MISTRMKAGCRQASTHRDGLVSRTHRFVGGRHIAIEFLQTERAGCRDRGESVHVSRNATGERTMLRDRISQAMKDALKSGQKERLGTLRLMVSALKDRELGIGTGGIAPAAALTDADVVQVLQKMVKQRRDSVTTYEQA